MTMPPMVQRVMDYLISQREASLVAPSLPAEFRAVAEWLSGDEARYKSLAALLNYRVSGREALPLPSNPHEVFIQVGRDREARDLARLLSSLCYSPVETGSREEHERGPTDRGPGSGRV